ncbi:MAG TPA: RNA polymerase factor sigma-54 [Armatimonadota bacterium]|nr:RNA polymerase factor sigma-54 [Armatimonadota bacterium]
MQQSPSFRQEMSVRMIPEQIVASTILRMSTAEISAHVVAELEENPALEISDTIPADIPYPDVSALSWREISAHKSWQPTEDEEEERLLNIPAQESLRDYLWRQFVSASDERDHRIGHYLIDCIDDNGYLDTPLTDIAVELGENLERVEQVLHQVQELDPPGIGARDLRECLLLQLKSEQWRNDAEAATARDILERGWDLLVHQDFAAMALHLGHNEETLQSGYAFIRRRLIPYPGYAVPIRSNAENNTALIPDVCILRTSNGYQVEITDVGIRASSLCINREYQNICRAMQHSSTRYSEAERLHVHQALERARFLLNGLARRARTLQRVTEYIISQQQAFIEGDYSRLRPLTRRDVARRIGLSESTVSRATIGKNIQLPSGIIVPFETFFDVAAAIKQRIAQLLDAETPDAPLKDQEIALRLRDDGIDIARRTVSKYREELGVPGYAERRRAILATA